MKINQAKSLKFVEWSAEESAPSIGERFLQIRLVQVRLRMSLQEALLKWLSLANNHESGLSALQVSDGITMSQVLHKIDPKHFTEVRTLIVHFAPICRAQSNQKPLFGHCYIIAFVCESPPTGHCLRCNFQYVSLF